MQSKGLAMLIQLKMLKKQEDHKKCQSIKNVKFNDLGSKSTVKMCSDKKCQEYNVIQSVTKKMAVQLKKPANYNLPTRKGN